MDIQNVQQAMEKRWVARMIDARDARVKGRRASHLGNMAAGVEIANLARDLGMEFDTRDNGALMQQVMQIESESEQAAGALGEG